MRSLLRKIYWLTAIQFGLDLRRMFQSVVGLPRFIVSLMRFRQGYRGRLELMPCLFDWYEEGGSTRTEYFWQDLYIAQKICDAKPVKHVDIGSRVDGFVAHVASYRMIEVFDIRPITSDVPGVVFKQADLMNPSEILSEYCDSVSCLHALEHFGLGRYGDPIDPQGYQAGFENMAKIVQQGGVFYLSVPIGIERVEFNAHRVFDPREIVRLAEQNQLVLERFASVAEGKLTESADPLADIAALSATRYALGIFTFRKQTKQVQA